MLWRSSLIEYDMLKVMSMIRILSLMLIAWIVEKSMKLLGECRSMLVNGFSMEEEEIFSLIRDIHFWLDACRNDFCNDIRAVLSKSINVAWTI